MIRADGKDSLFSLNTEALQAIIEQTWRCKLNQPLPVIQNYVLLLSKQFTFIRNNYPERYITNKRFLRLYAQNERLQAVMYAENKQSKRELGKNYDMLDTAKELEESLQRLKEYVQSATPYQSPRMLSHINSHLNFMRSQGYDNERRLRDFSEEVREMISKYQTD